MRTILIDGDILLFKITAASEVEIDWGEDFWTLHSDLGLCKEVIDKQIAEYKEGLKADDVVLALSTPKNFRYRILPTYKANRIGKRKPITYAPLKKYLIENYKTFLRPDIEGDDILGILATSPVIIKGEKVIVSLDKDLKSIPGKICDMRSQTEIEEITEEQADYFHMYQTLIGDTADGYAGCPTIGPKTAEKILENIPRTYAALWPVVVAQYIKKGLTEADALVQAQVARICRRDDYDFKKKEVILWQPPKADTL